MYFLKTNKILPSLFAFVAMLALPSVALALDMEYYVYGGFRETVSAFNKVALIYSDNQYKTVVAAVFIGMLAFGLFKANIQGMNRLGPWLESDSITHIGGRVTVAGVLVNMLISIIFYVGLVLPTATLVIYDADDNQFQAVGGIPQLIVLAAGGTNLIERSFVEIIETAGDPLSFSKQAGMKGIHFMNSLMPAAGRAPKGDSLLVPTVNAFIQNCLLHGVSQGNPTADEIMSGGTLLATTFDDAATAGNLTQIFNDAAPQGTGATCEAAWTNIGARFDAAFAATSAGAKGGFYWHIADACKDAGYDVFQSDATKADLTYNTCSANMNAFITTIDGNWDLNKFVKEMFLVNLFWLNQAVDNPDLMADRSVFTQYTSAFTQFVDGIATKRGVMIALVTAMLPFALVMMAGGQWAKMLNLTLGAYLFPAVWGILMAVASDFFLSAAVANWTSLLASWGVATSDVLQSDMAKRMMWWSVYLTATFGLTSMLVTRMGFFAAGAGHMAGAQGAAAEGDLSRGRLGTGTREASAVSTAEGAATKYAGYTREVGGVPAMANSGTSWAQHEMLNQSGSWDAKTQSVNAGRTYTSASGTQQQTDLNGVTSAQTIQQVGFDRAVGAGVYSQSAGMAAVAEKIKNTGGDWSLQGQLDAAKNIAEDQAHKNDPSLKQHIAGLQQIKAIAQTEHGEQSYQAAKKEAAIKGQDLSREQFWGQVAGVQATKGFEDSAAILRASEKEGGNLNQLYSKLADVKVAGEVGAMKGYAGQGRTINEDQTKSLRQDLSALGADATKEDYKALAQKHNLAGGDKAVESLQGLHQNLLNTPDSGAREKAFVKAAQGELKVDNTYDRTAQTAQTAAEKQVGGMAGARELASIMGTSVEDAEQYLKSREGQKAYAEFSNMEKYAEEHGQKFLDIARQTQRTYGLSLSAEEAKAYGLKGGAGLYSASVDANGKAVFTDLKSGRQAWHGNRDIKEDTNKNIYDHRDLNATGSETLTGDRTTNDNSTTTKDGQHVHLVAKDGTVTKGEGVTDRNGKFVLTNGSEEQQIKTVKVVDQKDAEGNITAEVVETAVGNKYNRRVATTGDGSHTTDTTVKNTFGASNQNIGDLSGSMGSDAWKSGDVNAAGTASDLTAIGRGAVKETAGIVADAGTLISGPKSLGGGKGPGLQTPYTKPEMTRGSAGESIKTGGWRNPVVPKNASAAASPPASPAASASHVATSVKPSPQHNAGPYGPTPPRRQGYEGI